MCHWSLGHLTNECEKRYSSLSTGASENKFVEAASEYLDFVGRVFEGEIKLARVENASR